MQKAAEAHAPATRAHSPKKHETSPSCGPAETLRRRDTQPLNARNRLAGAQRSRLHLRNARQKAETEDRVLQDRTRGANLSHRLTYLPFQSESAGGTFRRFSRLRSAVRIQDW